MEFLALPVLKLAFYYITHDIARKGAIWRFTQRRIEEMLREKKKPQ